MSAVTEVLEQTRDGRSQLVATLATSRGTHIECLLFANCAERLTVSFPYDQLGPSGGVLAGEHVDVTVEVSGSLLETEVTSTRFVGSVEICQLRVLRQLDGPPLVIGEQRAASRFSLPENTPVVLSFETTDESEPNEQDLNGRLQDLSSGGCSVRLGRAEHERFGAATNATITFRVEPTTEPLALQVERVHSHLTQGNIVTVGFRWAFNQEHGATLATIEEIVTSSNHPHTDHPIRSPAAVWDVGRRE